MADQSDVMKQVTKLIAACYEQQYANSLSEARVCALTAPIGKPGMTRVPKLASLPPTTEAFVENVKRAHLQTFIWKNALLFHPQKLDPIAGWVKEERMNSLQQTTLPMETPLAPS